MYGDMMYCNHCGKPFMDEWRGHDTRTEKALLTNCPFCHSCSVLNASWFMDEYEKRAPNQHSNTILYKHINKLWNLWITSWHFPAILEVLLTKAEQENYPYHNFI